MVEINEAFDDLFTSDKRYIIITGGRGSGKSFAVNTFATLLSYEKGHRILFTRYTLTSAPLSIIPEFREKIDLLNVHGDFEIKQQEILNTNTGVEILFRGIKTSAGNQTANLKSLQGVSTFILDEAEELVDEDEFDRIDLSIRNKFVQNRIILILNPTDKTHWIWKRFFETSHKLINIDGVDVPVSTHPNVTHIHTTYLDNEKFLSQSFLDNIEEIKRIDRKKYANTILGSWKDQVDEPVLEQLNYFMQTDQYYDMKFSYIDTADAGNDYLCLVVAGILNNKIHIIDTYLSRASMEYTLADCANKLKENGVSICRVESNNGGRLFALELYKLCENIEILPCHESRNKHTRILNNGFWIKKNVIFEKNIDPQFVSQVVNYSKIEKENKNKHDDAIDALSGLCDFAKGLFQIE